MFFVDSHCHLVFSKFENVDVSCEKKYDVDSIIKRATDAQVKYLLAIGTELFDTETLQSISQRHPSIFRTVGIHPLEAKRHYDSYRISEITDIITKNCSCPETVGIGEIGLDYHYEKESEKQQKELFDLQMNIAQKCCLPVSIHSRDAWEDVIDILQNHKSTIGVIHCFSGEKDFAKRALDLGYYISFSGVITYKNATELRNSLSYIPLDRLLIETDSPFLSPIPFRGKINEPAFVVNTAKKIAELLNLPLEKIADISSKNFFTLFSKGKTRFF
ncbi:MAG: TatD family hydrolase [Holosporaceae bacterium]|nr:TatD family hydrolase [Holosporaceae bacterium]